ncbi:NAD(P)-binding protein [Hypoxylon sp. NC1633]|nr:NAD(P)-binding protein [Hypoxylon sp. NC1633]
MSRKNLALHLAERPTGDIVPGKTFKLVETDAPTAEDLKDGQILIETLYMSMDPAMRGWLSESRSYVAPLPIGERMRGLVVARVLASKSAKAKEGELGLVRSGWTEVAVVDESLFSVVDLPRGAKITDALGAIGMTGMTAYVGLKHIGQPQPGETVVVSGAAGATGLVAGQICKIRGCRVVGIAGSDDKCEMLVRELGFDLALNYRSPGFRDDFVKATPDYIDVFWDNVGGEILEVALDRAAAKARFVMCGAISGYNNKGASTKGVRNLTQVVKQRIRMEGFIAPSDFADDFPEARQQLGAWLSEGKIKRKETIVKGGIRAADTVIGDLFSGKNVGKLVLEVKAYEEVGDSKL